MKFAQPIMLCASLCWLITACGLPDGNLPYQPEEQKPDTPDPDRELLKPMLMPISSSTCAESIPVTGTAQGGGTVIIQGGLSSTTQDVNPSSGHFCMDVPLRLGTVNVLEVQVSDPELGLSEPNQVTVEQVDCGDEQKPVQTVKAESTNVILAAQPFSNTMPTAGKATALTDGDPETSVTYNGKGIWIVFKLTGLMTLDKMVIRWREWLDQGDEQFGTAYTIFGSNKEDPGDPLFTSDEYGISWELVNDNWFIIDEVENGTGCLSNTCGMDVRDFAVQPVVQYVGIMMKRSGSLWGLGNKYAFSELEVWDKPKKDGPTVPAEMVATCATLDSSF